jgi:acetolactate synthase-1/2/3 large subunit
MEAVTGTALGKSALPQPERLRVADVLVRGLREHGVRVVFGLPGGAISPIHDALLDFPDIQVVTSRHESGAVFAAAGYAQAGGKLGVALVTSGPGVLNAFTALASAYCDGLPLLLLVGESPRKSQGRGGLQDGSAHHLNIVGMLSHVSKMARELVEPANAPALLRRAIATALSGRQGPVVLTLPLDAALADGPPTEIESDVSISHVVPGAAVQRAADLLARAERVAIFAGSGVRRGNAAGPLRLLAERLQCPVMTTPKAKGVFPEDHPLSLGVFGIGGHPSTVDYLKDGVDVLLVVGSSLGELATEGWTKLLCPRQALVHVDVDALPIGRSYATALGIVAPAQVFLRQLAIALSSLERAPRVFGLRAHALADASDTLLVSPQRALDELQQILPPDTIYTCDVGEHSVFATHYLRLARPDQFIFFQGLGSMGASIGAAIGAQLAKPERSVAVICGDACFAMNAAEVATAVELGLRLRIFVFNDQRMGMVELGNEVVYGRSPSFPTAPMDVQKLARGFGAETLRVRRSGDLLRTAPFLRSCTGTVVVDVRIDPSVRLPKKGRFDVFAQKTVA